ncbi:hypothetical protein [Actinoallomurus iriomotensis]|uniref:Integral membrane protein n=1 Tax=Actinoallomurus iriomotensis TaxID=478107 RepID=A0A9W6W3J8_9ACTN|nr:hypothetical protein [Actinoallomurus iriomotensis]GLY88041.1 hypothetical protein Airi02_059700 [Actinoallomurus iriomotensis]
MAVLRGDAGGTARSGENGEVGETGRGGADGGGHEGGAEDAVLPGQPGYPAYRRAAVGAVVWAGFVAVVFAVGAALRAAGKLPVDPVPPLHASARLLIGPLVPAAVVALAGVAVLPAAVRRLRWRPLLAVAWLASALWAVVLQWPDGVSRPLTAPTEYLAGLPAMGDHPLSWLRGFTRHLQEYPTHVKGHPPLPDLILWILRWTGLNEPGWAAALVIAVGTSSTVAIAMTIRTLADEETARRALPFLVLAPTVICLATSMDAFFLGAAAWAVALTAEATAPAGEDTPHPPWGTIPLQSSSPVGVGHKAFHRLWITVLRWAGVHGRSTVRTARDGAVDAQAPGLARKRLPAVFRPRLGRLVRERFPAVFRPCPGGLARERLPAAFRPRQGGLARRLVVAFVGGIVTGSLPYLNYGLVTILALPLAVFLLTWPRRAVVVTFVLGCAVVPLAFTLGGFLWWDGVAATHAAWAAGAGSERPYAYFLVGDLAVLALIIGPMAAGALPYVLRRGGALGVLTAAALLGVLALDLSGVTRGEVERIWLPYAAWLTAAAAVHRPPARRALLVQAVTALLIQALVRSPW